MTRDRLGRFCSTFPRPLSASVALRLAQAQMMASRTWKPAKGAQAASMAPCERPGVWLSWPMSREDRLMMLEALQ